MSVQIIYFYLSQGQKNRELYFNKKADDFHEKAQIAHAGGWGKNPITPERQVQNEFCFQICVQKLILDNFPAHKFLCEKLHHSPFKKQSQILSTQLLALPPPPPRFLKKKFTANLNKDTFTNMSAQISYFYLSQGQRNRKLHFDEKTDDFG